MNSILTFSSQFPKVFENSSQLRKTVFSILLNIIQTINDKNAGCRDIQVDCHTTFLFIFFEIMSIILNHSL